MHYDLFFFFFCAILYLSLSLVGWINIILTKPHSLVFVILHVCMSTNTAILLFNYDNPAHNMKEKMFSPHRYHYIGKSIQTSDQHTHLWFFHKLLEAHFIACLFML